MGEQMLTELIAEIDALDRDATPAPWAPPVANGYRLYSWLPDANQGRGIPLTCIIADATEEAHWGCDQVPGADGMKAWANVRLIALLRNAWPTLRAALRASPEAGGNQWIPVTERLPERGSLVLVAFKGGAQAVAKWGGKHWIDPHSTRDGDYFTTPKYWRPLPLPPSAGGKG